MSACATLRSIAREGASADGESNPVEEGASSTRYPDSPAQDGAGDDEKQKPGFKTNALEFWPLARARHVLLLLDFIAAARSAFARLVPAASAAKRKAQGKGVVGRTPMRRSDLHRARSKQTKLARLKSHARKIKPRRPGDPDPTELLPR